MNLKKEFYVTIILLIILMVTSIFASFIPSSNATKVESNLTCQCPSTEMYIDANDGYIIVIPQNCFNESNCQLFKVTLQQFIEHQEKGIQK